ncbi:hypothetical protein WN943_003079 [Citrus x changshan-huyou]
MDQNNLKQSVCVKEMLQFRNSYMQGLNEDVIEELIELIGESNKAELEKKWTQIKILELELNLRKSRVLLSQINVILNAYN